MANDHRWVLPNHPHHVVHRGNNKQKIFFSEHDYHYYKKLLFSYSRDFKVRVAAYCLMSNHIHLILYPPEAPLLSLVMKMIDQLYAQYINATMHRVGKLWGNRFTTTIIDPADIWYVARYIDNNPVTARIVPVAEQYEHSSARTHLGMVSDRIIAEDIIQGKHEAYAQFLKENVSAESKTYEYEHAVKEKVFGSAKFVRMIGTYFPELPRKHRGRPRKAHK